MTSQTKETLLRDDPHLLDKYAGRFIHNNGSDEEQARETMKRLIEKYPGVWSALA